VEAKLGVITAYKLRIDGKKLIYPRGEIIVAASLLISLAGHLQIVLKVTSFGIQQRAIEGSNIFG
jgi:hypothetical protein